MVNKIIFFIFFISLSFNLYSSDCQQGVYEAYRSDVEWCKDYASRIQPSWCEVEDKDMQLKSTYISFTDVGNNMFRIDCRGIACDGSTKYFDYVRNGSNTFSYSCFSTNDDNDDYIELNISSNSTNNDTPRTSCGSIIKNSNMAIGEVIPLTGLDFSLTHFSDRTEGRLGDYETDFKIITKNLMQKISGVEFYAFDDQNNLIKSQSYGRNVDTSFYLSWDGKNLNGEKTWGSRKFKFVYKTISADNSISDLEYFLNFGNFKAIKLGLGGWVPSIWSFYDTNAERLYLGNGNISNVKAVREGSFFRVASSSNGEIYYFDELGRHSFTKTNLTGAILYRFTYDDVTQKLLSITDSFNRVTRFKYDQNNKLFEIISPENVKIKVVLNSDGYLQTITNPKNESYKMEYVDQKGLLKKFTKPTGVFSDFFYDDKGNLTRDLNSNGKESKLEKTSVGVKTTSALGRVFENNYNSKTNQEEFISPSGLKTTYTNSQNLSSVENVISIYKSDKVSDPRFGDQVKNFSRTTVTGFGTKEIVETNAANLFDTSNIFSINSLTKTISEGPSTINSNYDGLTRTQTVTTSEGRQFQTQLDSYERPILIKQGKNIPIRYQYQNELLTSIIQADRKTEFYYHSNSKLLMSVKSAEGQSMNFLYDDAQRLRAKRLPDGRVVQYQYDSNNNLVSITPPGRPAHKMNFGINELLSSYNPPSLQGLINVNTQYSYNKDKDIIKITRPDGEIINFNWNQTTGLLDQMSSSSGVKNYQYQNEQLVNVADQNGQKANFTYMGNVVSGLQILDSNQNEIYFFSRTPSEKFPGFVGSESLRVKNNTLSIAREYDNDKALVHSGDLSLEYNIPNGQLAKTTLDNIKEYFTYNKVGEVKSYKAKIIKNNKEELIYSYRLDRDKLGRIIKKFEFNDKKENEFRFSYDQSGRLIHVHGDNRNSIYKYDQNSNRIFGVSNHELFIGIYDNQDRLIRHNNSSFNYNANGDMTLKTDLVKFDFRHRKPIYESTAISYDEFGNLKQYGKISYRIDPLNKRLSRAVNGIITNMYAYNPEGQLIAELDRDGNLLKYFVYGSKSHVPDYFVDNANIRFKIITDHLGSVRFVVNSTTGAIVHKMNYDEFGKVLLDSNPNYIPFGFAGGIYDPETKLVRFGVRDYDPEIGRWTSKDSIRFKAGDTNLYGYTFSDPVNLIDPSGRIAVVDDLAGAIIIGGVTSGIISATGTYLTGGSSSQIAASFGSGFLGGAVGAASLVTGTFIGGLASIPLGVGTTLLASTLDGFDPAAIYQIEKKNNQLNNQINSCGN